MRFRFTLPAASLENSVLFFGLFFFLVLQVYLRSLHVVETRSGHRIRAASPMMEDFISRKTLPISVNQTSGCIPFHIASNYAPKRDYQQSSTLPQWMKGTELFLDGLAISCLLLVVFLFLINDCMKLADSPMVVCIDCEVRLF